MKKTFLLCIILSSVGSAICQNYFFVPKALEEQSETDDGRDIDLIGSGAGGATPSQDQAKAATGFSYYKFGEYYVTANYTFTNTSTITFDGKSKNGGAILLPGVGANSLQLDFQHYKLINKHFGLSASGVFAWGTWKYKDIEYSVSPISLKVQVNGPPIKFDGDHNKVLFTYTLGASFRGYSGDAAQEHDLKKALFETTQTGFFGLEGTADLWINDTHFFLSLPYLFGNTVKGLTSLQISGGISVSGRVLKNIMTELKKN